MKTIFSLFLGFHSINVPSEWGQDEDEDEDEDEDVSIQLMSPASGDSTPSVVRYKDCWEFPFN
jgi:hypothetical protein